MTSEYLDLSSRQGSGEKLADTRFRIHHPKRRRSGGNTMLEISPPFCGIVESHFHFKQFAELGEQWMGESAFHTWPQVAEMAKSREASSSRERNLSRLWIRIN